MTTYCTLEDILAVMDEQDVIRFSTDADAEEPDADNVEAALKAGTAMVDSYISDRYGAGLPAPVPDLVISLAVDISAYRLASRKGAAPAEFRTRYEDAEKFLQRIAAGDAGIPGITVDEETTTEDPEAAVVASDAVFSGSGTGMRGY